MAKHAFLVVAGIALAASAATAQDFGTDWIDRITQQLSQERGPLQPMPWELHATGGLAYYFDDNIYLTDKNEVDTSIIIPFIRGTATYTEQRFEFQADLLANYKLYLGEDNDLTVADEDGDDDEERFYARVRQAGTRYNLEVAGIIQRVSDPLGVVFADRAERVVANVLPRVEFDLTRQWAIEMSANYQVVRYEDDALGDPLENNSSRVEGALVYKTAYGFDVLGQIGWQDISYREDQTQGAPPDAFGWYGRLGFRGYIMPRLYVEALGGFDHIESDFYLGTSVDESDTTGGGFASVRYEVTETVKFTADYSRQFTFAGAGDPYQRVDRTTAILDVEATEEIGFKGRFQYDHAMTAQSTERSYFSAGGGAWYKPMPMLMLDAGVTVRSGDAEDQTGLLKTEYDNVIFHVGVAATY